MTDRSYNRMRSDHEYLWETYGPADDMTGAYVDQGDLWKLLKSPTKKTAAGCYEDQIIFWFQRGTAKFDARTNGYDEETVKNDPRVKEIADNLGLHEYLEIWGLSNA